MNRAKKMGSFTLGTRHVVLPSDALISVTLVERMSMGRSLMLSLVNMLLVMGQLKRDPGLLYSELVGAEDPDGSKWGVTLSVWESKAMMPYRDSSGHSLAMRFFSWIFFGRKVQSYFLTCRALGRLPSYEESRSLAQQYGKHFDSGKLNRTARPPKIWFEALDLGAATER